MSDKDRPGPALEKWREAIEAYMEGQGDALAPLRAREQPHPPWPDHDNPMIAYLVARALEVAEEEGLEGAIVWLAVHGWFEGALDERARMLRSLTA